MSKKPKQRYIVTKDGVDCGFAPPIDLGLANRLASGHITATSLCGKRGILVKKPESPHVFGGEKTATRYIEIATRIATKFRGTMGDDLPKLKPLIEPGVFATRSFLQ